MKKLTLLVCLLSHTIYAQIDDFQYLDNYKLAVRDYNSGNVSIAQSGFEKLLSYDLENPVTPYVYFYLQQIAGKNNESYKSREYFRTLNEKFPYWENLSVARFNYAEENFKSGYFDEGLKALELIDNPEFENQKNGLIKHYLDEVNDLNSLKTLYRAHPNEKAVARRIIEIIQSEKHPSRDDLEFSDLLTNRFFESETIVLNTPPPSKFDRSYDDDEIDVALLLPYDLNEVAVKANANFVYDFMAGVNLAFKELKREGTKINFYAFDVGKDESDFNRIQNDENFKKIDIMFGPLYGKPNLSASKYASENGIIQIHPISNSSSLIEGSKNVFLVQPSLEVQAKAAADFATSLEKAKSVAIYYGSSSKSRNIAQNYSNFMKKNGYSISDFAQYIDISSIKIGQKVGHVFYADEDINGDNFVRALIQSEINAPIIATSSAFNFEKTNRNILNKEIYFIDPLFIDFDKEEVKKFKADYVKEMNALPSTFSYSAYDMMLFFGRMLQNGKSMFRIKLNSKKYDQDYLLTGYDFENDKNVNNVVPIVRFQDGKFQLINE